MDDVDTPVSFSPDGRRFAFIRGPRTQIVIADAAGGSQRVLAVREGSQEFPLVAPDWSPDGKMLAAAAVDTSGESRSSIVVLPVDDGGGNSRELFATADEIGRVRWLPDGSGLLAIISETLANQYPRWDANVLAHLVGGAIWRIDYPGGRAERLTSDLTEYNLCCLDISASGNAVTSVINSFVSDLWIAAAV